MTGMWTDNGFRRVLGADPKPPKRIKADQNDWRRLRAEKVDRCRICELFVGDMTLHHIVPRAQSGDDVADNLVPLCGSGTTGCHGLVEDRDMWARSLLGRRLSRREIAYVVAKRGAGWLERHYGVAA